MNGIKRYYPSDVRLKSGDPQIVLTEHLAGQLCSYEDVEPIIQHNKELETENKELKVEIAQLLKLKAQLDDDNNRLKKGNLILNLQLLTIEHKVIELENRAEGSALQNSQVFMLEELG